MVDPDKIKSTFMVNKEVYKRIRILALEKSMEVSGVIEEAMREKLEREFPHYKPLPPQSQSQTYIQTEKGTSPPVSQQSEPEQSKQPLYHMVLPYELTVNLPGIKFPTNKNKIMECAEKANLDLIIRHIQGIPNKTYKNKTELKDELLDNARSIGSVLKELVDDGHIKYKIDDRELKKEQYQHKMAQQKEESDKFNTLQDVRGVIESPQ